MRLARPLAPVLALLALVTAAASAQGRVLVDGTRQVLGPVHTPYGGGR